MMIENGLKAFEPIKASSSPYPLVHGYAIVFENIVVYAEKSRSSLKDAVNFILNNKKKNFGERLGVIEGLVPLDPYRVTYQYLKQTKGFKHRQQEKKVLKKMKLSRGKMRLMKHRGQQELRA